MPRDFFRIFKLNLLIILLLGSSFTFFPFEASGQKNPVIIDEVGRTRRGPRNPPIIIALTQFDIAGLPGVKVQTNRNDWYYISTSQLVNAGFDTNSDTTNWQMYVDGTEVPIQVNSDKSIEFYGSGTDTISTDSKVYYLIQGNSPGLRIQTENAVSAQNPTADYFQTTAVFKDRSLYTSSILNGETENWYSAFINSNQNTISINAEKLAANGQANLQIKLQGLTNVEHFVHIKINNYVYGVTTFSNKSYHQVEFNVPLSELNEFNNQVSLQAVGASNDFSVLDSVTLSYPKKFEAVNDRIRFHVPAGQTVRVGGFSSNNIKLYEINNNQVNKQLIVNPEINNESFGFRLASSSSDRDFIAVANSGAVTVFKTEQNIPSSLNSSSNQADFLIISPASLNTIAQTLADRRETQGIRTKVVLTEDIADEFGFGTISPEAIKGFLQHAVTNWSRKPDYVLLFGDSSYDMRNYLGGEDRNLVPTKLIETFDMETSSDGWLVDFDNDGIENIALGRLPVGNVSEANLAVAKIIRYETQNISSSKSAVLVADYFFEILNGELQNLLPGDVSSQKIERMSMSDSQMRQEILNHTNQNPTFVSYLGHGSTAFWSTGNVFGVSQAQSLTNQKLSFYMLMTCLNGFTHNPYSASLAETLVLSENGAIAVWASSGSTYASGQIQMGQDVVSLLFPQGKQRYRLGDIVKTAKQSSNDWDARRTWQLIGDPTLYIQ